MFDGLNEDGSKCRSTGDLRGGFRLSKVTKPSVESICRFAILTSAHKTLPDIFYVEDKLCINQTMRDAIASLEVEVHQFLPITLFQKKAQVFDGQYYLLNICQILDSLVFSKSNLRLSPTGYGGEHVTLGLNPKDYRTLRKTAIQGRHLWREKIYLPDFYISDDLYALFLSQKTKGVYRWAHFRVNEE